MIYLVVTDNQDSSSGVDITGIFDSKVRAESFAKSEGPEYKVIETDFGPIDWRKVSPLPPFSWDL